VVVRLSWGSRLGVQSVAHYDIPELKGLPLRVSVDEQGQSWHSLEEYFG
jgi:hypothetical protein